MTIISHKHRFIFLKARKVGGSSILQALGKHCCSSDIVTSPANLEGLPSFARNTAEFVPHMDAQRIRNAIDEETWNSYCKITIVRNPWDEVVSRFHFVLHRMSIGESKFQMKRSSGLLQMLPRRFRPKKVPLEGAGDLDSPNFDREFLRELARESGRNNSFFFDKNGKPLADIYMRFENLQSDFESACKKLGLPVEPLPHLKGKIRPKKIPYQHYYDDKTRDIVAKKSSWVIQHFGYEF